MPGTGDAAKKWHNQGLQETNKYSMQIEGDRIVKVLILACAIPWELQ